MNGCKDNRKRTHTELESRQVQKIQFTGERESVGSVYADRPRDTHRASQEKVKEGGKPVHR